MVCACPLVCSTVLYCTVLCCIVLYCYLARPYPSGLVMVCMFLQILLLMGLGTYRRLSCAWFTCASVRKDTCKELCSPPCLSRLQVHGHFGTPGRRAQESWSGPCHYTGAGGVESHHATAAMLARQNPLAAQLFASMLLQICIIISAPFRVMLVLSLSVPEPCHLLSCVTVRPHMVDRSKPD
jgi:hypothetical protein